VLNRSETIRAALESVASQLKDADAVQHIIVDGGSTDGTLEIVAEYHHLELVREPRRGIYVAFNQGLRRAQNDVICFVNSDDQLEVGALKEVAEIFQSSPNIEIVAGRATLETAAGDEPAKRLVIPQFGHEAQSWDYLFHCGIAFNARFIRRSTMERVGPFNEEYLFAGDREMLIRMKLAGVSTLPVNQIFYRYLGHDGSATLDPRRKNYIDIRREHIAIADKLIDGRTLADDLAGKLHAWKACEYARMAAASLMPRSWGRGWLAAQRGLQSDAPAFLMFIAGRRNWS